MRRKKTTRHENACGVQWATTIAQREKLLAGQKKPRDTKKQEIKNACGVQGQPQSLSVKNMRGPGPHFLQGQEKPAPNWNRKMRLKQNKTSAKHLDEVKRNHERQMTKWASKRQNQQNNEDITMKSTKGALSNHDETQKDTQKGAINTRCQQKWAG